MRSAHQNRNGVTLLFVVSMIVLFLLMGTAFVVVSNDFLRSARKRARLDLHTVDGTAYIERAFYDLVRGPSLQDMTSPLRGHSLLADMYGYGFTAKIDTAEVNDSQHFITLTLDFAGSGQSILDGSPFQPEAVPCLAGQVLSVVSGPANGLTARIVDHQIFGSGSSLTHSLFVLPQWIDSSFNVSNAAELVGEKVIINGRPFAGTGAGNFNVNAATDQPALSDAALNPDLRGIPLADIIGANGPGYFSTQQISNFSPNHSGPNESYDTFDFQNMFLAGINPDGTVNTPSFHRQSLVSNPRGDFRAFKTGGANNDGVVVDNDNNGQVDGIWMDIGLPSLTHDQGVHFKPLISYTVVDLDGRINLNAHGNLRQSDPQLETLDLLGLQDLAELPLLHRGQGFGPPEINPAPLLLGATPSIISQRYGADGLPGEAGVRDVWSNYKLFGYPDISSTSVIPGTVDGHFGTTMDIHGRFAIGYPNDIRDLSDPSFPIGLPVADISTSSLTTEAVDSAYEMTFADGTMAGPGDRGFDDPFSARELEAVLRQFDPDSNLLDRRLLNLGVFSGPGSAANSVTTASFEVPTTYRDLASQLKIILQREVPSAISNREQFIRDTMQRLLPPEICRGLPMNINRPFGDGVDNNGNGVIDEIGETGFLTHPSGVLLDFDEDNDAVGSGDDDAYLARSRFARQLYIVTLLSTEKFQGTGRIPGIVRQPWYDFNDDGTTDDQDRLDFRKVIAQWAINVVDFRDPDSIMTPFEVDLNPWDGWDVDGDLTSEEDLDGQRVVLWGSERPELLITETFASHDRRTQNLDIDPTMLRVKDPADESAEEEAEFDDDFDSHLVPAVSAFFELYNPWVMNDANQIRPAELYDPPRNGVDLQKTVAGSPVWRLLVTGHDEADLDPDDMLNNGPASGGPPESHQQTTSVRRIYFAQPSPAVDAGPEVYFPDPDIAVGPVVPGVYAVVGSAGVHEPGSSEFTTFFGRRSTPEALDELKLTRRISLDAENAELEIARWDSDTSEMDLETRNVVTLPIGFHDNGQIRNLGVSDPLAGYTGLSDEGMPIQVTDTVDGQKFTENQTMPGTPTDYAFDEPVDRRIDQEHYDEYLVNDGVRPGYRTVHLQRLANPLSPFDAKTNPYRTIDTNMIDLVVFNGAETIADPNNTPGKIRFGTHERHAVKDSGGSIPAQKRLLFQQDRQSQAPLEDDPTEDLDDHIFSYNLTETLGGLNDAYRIDDATKLLPFAWLTWNNRPFASQLELVNVPFTSSYWLTRLFNENAEPGRNVYRPPSEENEETEARNYTAHFPHLLNFYADQVGSGTKAASLHRVFDCLEVPSRFVGTESYVNPETFVGTRHGLSFGLTPPFDTISNYRYPGKLNINTVLDPKVWQGLMSSYAKDSVNYGLWSDSRAGSTSNFRFGNPYRSSIAANLVPQLPLDPMPPFFPRSLVVAPVECGLFRPTPGDSERPLFDFDPATKLDYNNDDRAAYFKYDMRQRLGNLVTSRSSVFAIWITVGYFEMNADGSLKTKADGTGCEVGCEIGEVRRHRGFYIFDRSIPVAFEPGKNHNVDRAVLVRSIIE